MDSDTGKISERSDAAGGGFPDLIAAADLLRSEFADAGVEIDALASDPAEVMERCWESGMFELSVPSEYGGLSDGGFQFALSPVVEIGTSISAIDGAAGQNYMTSHICLRWIFHELAALPASTKRQLADEFRNRPLRFVLSNTEATNAQGPRRRVVARPENGGLVVSGTKRFNTNSGADGYALVGCLMAGTEDGALPFNHHALIPLAHPGVVPHRDWDNMGQRGTISQGITYEDVFVPDGWHFPAYRTGPEFTAGIFLFHGMINLGIGFGAFDAVLEYLRTFDRPSMPQFDSVANDPLLKRQLGEFAVKLRAAHALQREVAHRIESEFTDEDADEMITAVFESKVASVQASLDVAGAIHGLAGARSTSNSYRLDRFWRNARTFSVHDPIDAKLVSIGGWHLNRQAPEPFIRLA